MPKLDRLSKKEQEELVFDLVSAFVTCRTTQDAAYFLQDLLTLREMKILSKRLRIAKLLLKGMTYEQIEQELHVSHSTVAKVGAWLIERGDGFRNIVKKLPQNNDLSQWREFSEWDRMKRKYPMYFWPELLLEEIIKSANRVQKERMKSVLSRLEEKSDLHKNIEKLLKESKV